MTEAETPVWLQQLKRAIRGNRRDAHNRYVQFATLGLDGKPRVRMVVFRGFSLSEASFFIITDARSEKVKELAQCPDVEVSWYFTQTREQFRLQCSAVTHSHGTDADLHRDALWKGLSDAAKAQFFWPEPGLPSGEGQSLEITTHPPETFVVIECSPQRVDHLVLRQNTATHALRFDGLGLDRGFDQPITRRCCSYRYTPILSEACRSDSWLE